METVKYLPTGDCALSVQFGSAIDPAIYDRVRALRGQIERSKLPGIVEMLPTYRSLMIHYDPQQLPFDKLVAKLKAMVAAPVQADAIPKKVITVPVCFGGEYGEDLDYVAQYHNTTPEEIIREFCGTDFLVYMLGFTPGYPYIGGIPSTLETPRLKTPRVKVPVGAVGIGGQQLGIYPMESPGGFQLVGNTPVCLYDQHREMPTLFEAGEYVRFQAVTPEEYKEIQQQVAAGTYVCPIREG